MSKQKVLHVMPCPSCESDASAVKHPDFMNQQQEIVNDVGVVCTECLFSCLANGPNTELDERRRLAICIKNWNHRQVSAHDVVSRLKKLQFNNNRTVKSEAADDIICDLLKRIGFENVVIELNKVKKGY